MNVLVIAAHPDDEVLGCGGTMRRLANEGHAVHILIAGEGVTSRYDKRELADANLLKELHKCSQDAADAVGAKSLTLKNLPDNRFDSLPLLDVVKVIEEVIKDIQPEVIYTQHGGDLNIDHRVLHQAVLTATRPMEGQIVREIYAFEVPSSTEWAFGRIDQPFRANYFVDISETLDVKIKAMEFYEPEARPFPHPRSSEALRAIAMRWGSVVGCHAAEPFELVRAIRHKEKKL